MDEHKRDAPEEAQDDVKFPEERVEDLEPDAEAAGDVKAGTYQWWMKVESSGPDD